MRRRASRCSRCSGASRRDSPPGVWITLVDRAAHREPGRGARGARRALQRRGCACARRCRCSACRSRSRTTSTSPACRPPPPARPSRYVAAAHAARGRAAARRRRASASARPTSTSSPPAWSARARRTARAEQRFDARDVSAAARARARRSRSRAATCRSRSAPTPPARAACRPAFNNIVGLKPTPGRVSTRGVVPACRSVDCVSVFALTVADAARVLARRSKAPTPTTRTARFALGPARCRAALALRRAGAARASTATPATRPAFDERAWRTLRALGHERRRRSTSRRCTRSPTLLYGGPWVAERHAVDARTCSMRNPRRSIRPVRSVIGAARALSARPMPSAASTRCAPAQRDARAIWDDVDVLMVPTAPAIRAIAEVDADPVARQRAARHLHQLRQPARLVRARAAGRLRRATACRSASRFIAPRGQRRRARRASAQRWHARAGAAARRDAARALPRAAEPIARAAPASAHAARRRRRRAPVAACRSTAQLRRARRAPAARRRAPRRATACCAARHDAAQARPGARRRRAARAIEVEVWEMPTRARSARFVALIPAPLGIGTLELADGSRVQGFLCEAHALAGADDITRVRRLARLPRSVATAPSRAERVIATRTSSLNQETAMTSHRPAPHRDRSLADRRRRRSSSAPAPARARRARRAAPSCARRRRRRSASASGRSPPACRSSPRSRRATSRKPASMSSRSSSPARSR